MAKQTIFNEENIWKTILTTQKMKFSIKDFFSKCGQIRIQNQIFKEAANRYNVYFSSGITDLYYRWKITFFVCILHFLIQEP